MTKPVMKRLLPFALCAVLGSCADAPPEKKPEAGVVGVAPETKPVKMPPTNRKLGSSTGISLDDFFALQQAGKALIYDVRVPYFYAIDHIPGAINWPFTDYQAQVQARDTEIRKALEEGREVVVYCFNLGCPEARNVAKKLARRDYKVRVLSRGIDSWREAGLPMVTGKAAE